MHIMYIAPMFHTNQVPIIKGWIHHGHDVTFVSHYKGNTENHRYLCPHILGYSKIFTLIYWVYKKIFAKSKLHSSYPEAFQDKCGFPSFIKFRKLVLTKKPALIIVRERSLYSITCYLTAKHLKIPCILYNQTPLWEKTLPKNDLPHKIIRKLTPNIRMTPVYGRELSGIKDNNSYYVPFVIEPSSSFNEKPHFLGEKINLLCVGKFETRKHQLMLLNSFLKLKEQYPITLTLVGEVSTPHHQEYFSKVISFIKKFNLEEYVFCHTNCQPNEMCQFYKQADLFVLPSTGEFASFSQLEAMANSLPVIVSDTNGTACYIENGLNGYLFSDENEEDLYNKLSLLLENKNNLMQMGMHSYNLVLEKYSFKIYFDNISHLLSLQLQTNER